MLGVRLAQQTSTPHGAAGQRDSRQGQRAGTVGRDGTAGRDSGQGQRAGMGQQAGMSQGGHHLRGGSRSGTAMEGRVQSVLPLLARHLPTPPPCTGITPSTTDLKYTRK